MENLKTVSALVKNILEHDHKARNTAVSYTHLMLKDAPIIILDEATSSVDPENEDELQRAIEASTHDKTIIMIAHRLRCV